VGDDRVRDAVERHPLHDPGHAEAVVALLVNPSAQST